MKGSSSLLLGLAINCIGIESGGGYPRFTFGCVDMLQGIEFIPAMIGVFAVCEVMRNVTAMDQQARS